MKKYIAELKVTNDSAVLIEAVKIQVGSDAKEIQKLYPGSSAILMFEIKTDSHYSVRVNFKGGGLLEQETGYLTRGFNFQDEVKISKTKIELVKEGIK